MPSDNLRESYDPARIYPCSSSKLRYITKPEFSDEDLGKPAPPAEPQPTPVKHWSFLPFWLTVPLLLLSLLFSIKLPVFLFVSIGLWLWAVCIERPKYRQEKRHFDSTYAKAIAAYKDEQICYTTKVIPEWQRKKRPQMLEQKTKEWGQSTIYEICRDKGWKVASPEEVEQTRQKGFIGRGEDEVNQALSKSKVHFFRQVKISSYYVADFVCFNPESGKLCVLEIDGEQHWKKSSRVQRDEQQMVELAEVGIPTIRFINNFAQNDPDECVRRTQALLG